METNISHATQKFIESCDKFSVDLLREAIAEGADPYINCFIQAYWHIKSSAKYTLEKEGHYYQPEARARMNELLCNVEY